MTSNQLTEQQIDLLIENGYDIAHTLENLAENEINSDCFEVFSYSENGRETEWDGKITEFAQRAAKAIRHLTDATTALQAELQERRKAERDSNPVGWTDEAELRDVEKDGCGYLFKANPITPHADPRRVIPLYRHAQPAPVVPDGYVMVPKEPTEAMMLHNSGCQHHAWDDPDCAMRQTRRLIWSHMLAAAPQKVK